MSNGNKGYVPGLDLRIFDAEVAPYHDSHSFNFATTATDGASWQQMTGDLEGGRDASIFGYVPGWRLSFPALNEETRISDDPELELHGFADAAALLSRPMESDPELPPTQLNLTPAEITQVWKQLIRDHSPGNDPEPLLWTILEGMAASRGLSSNPRRSDAHRIKRLRRSLL